MITSEGPHFCIYCGVELEGRNKSCYRDRCARCDTVLSKDFRWMRAIPYYCWVCGDCCPRSEMCENCARRAHFYECVECAIEYSSWQGPQVIFE